VKPLSLAVGLAVIALLAVSLYKTALPLLRYRKAADKVRKLDGQVVAKVNEEERRVGSRRVSIAYPQYAAEIDGKTRFAQGSVAYPEIRIGEKAEMYYSELTGELWAVRDIPLMAAKLRLRIVGVAVLAVITVLAAVLL